MRNSPFTLLVIFSSIALSSYSQSRQVAVLQLEKDRFKAMINHDSAFLSNCLAEDLVYVHSNGMQDTKESLMNKIMSGALQYTSVDVQQADIRTFKETAWIHGAAKIKVRNGKDSPEIELSIRYLDIYKREDGEWRLVAWQSAKL
jgi:ketosteroid isomerase-like protein